MKNMLKLVALCAASGLVAPLSASVRDDRRDCSNSCFKSTLCDIKHLIEDLSGCGQSISIGQEDIGTTGYVIDKPGNYCLKEDVVFNPANPITFNPVTFVGGNGSGAAGFAAVSDGIVRGVFMTATGMSYTVTPNVVFGGTGTGAAGSAFLSESGEVEGVTITAGGTGYQDTVQAAITVKSSGVRISFNGNRLAQAGAIDASTIPNYAAGVNAPSSQVPFVVGILIPDLNPTGDINEVDLESIYIDGGQGKINGFSMFGVKVFAHTSDIQILNLTVANCGTLSSYYYRPFATYVPSGLPENAGQTPFGVSAICIGESDIFGLGPTFFTQMSGVPQNRVSSLILTNVSCLGNFMFGLCLSNATDSTITNCHFDNTISDDPTLSSICGAFAPANIGYETPSNINLTVQNSTFNGSAWKGDRQTEAGSPNTIFPVCLAAVCTRSSNLWFENCNFDHVSSTFAGDQYAPFVGGCVGGGCIDATWLNCSFSDIQAISAGIIVGFHESGTDQYYENAESAHNVRLINCVASNIQQHGDMQLPAPVFLESALIAGGFETYYAKNVYFENCIASDIIGNGPADQDSAIAGFFCVSGQDSNPDYEAVNYVFNGCISQRIMTVNGGSAAGFWMLSYYPNLDLRAMSFDGCIAEGSQSMIPTYTINPQTLQPYGNTQGAGIGFWFNSEFFGENDFPVSYTNCKALHNKGVPLVVDPDNNDDGNQYSAGFFANASTPGYPLQNQTYYNCEATDNVYGFLFQNATGMVVRNCRSDLNVASTTNTSADGTVGEGYTDLGQNQLVITTTIASVASPTVFNLVLEGTSPIDGAYVGYAISFLDGNNVGNVGVITNYVGSSREVTMLPDPFFYPPSAGDYVSIYTLPTPAAPGQSFSLFESNRAFANGAGYTDFGTNGNYNVIYGSGAEADWVPTLTGNLTHKTAIGGSFFPEANFIAHNLSITIA